ncbi:mediator of plasmid stability [Klebsiella pneumoniae]|nr:mediator of plasmid stability [Klebsiella pneumoniae]
MPDGQYSFYLHSDDRTDIAAMATISTISQPLRGEFIRTAATAGAVVYQVDARLPALIPVFFAGQLSAVRLCAVMALVSGTWSSLTGLPDEPENGGAALPVSPETEYQRRRYTLTLQNGRRGTGGKCADGSVIPSAWGSAEKPDYHRSCPPHDGAGTAAPAGQYAGTAHLGQ